MYCPNRTTPRGFGTAWVLPSPRAPSGIAKAGPSLAFSSRAFGLDSPWTNIPGEPRIDPTSENHRPSSSLSPILRDNNCCPRPPRASSSHAACKEGIILAVGLFFQGEGPIVASIHDRPCRDDRSRDAVLSRDKELSACPAYTISCPTRIPASATSYRARA